MTTGPAIARRGATRAIAAAALVVFGVAAALSSAACREDGPFGCPDDHVVRPGMSCENEGSKCTDESSSCGQVYICENGHFSATSESKSPCDAGAD